MPAGGLDPLLYTCQWKIHRDFIGINSKLIMRQPVLMGGTREARPPLSD